MRADIDADFHRLVRQLGARGDRIFEVLLDRVRREVLEFRQPTVACEPCRIPTKRADHEMIRMLRLRSGR